jgi:DNA-binding NarL/FixJ family response regulator
MASKKQKKYDQAISAAFNQPISGGDTLPALRRLIDAFFGKQRTYRPSTMELVSYHLTSREREIIYLAALGFSDKEIADALALNFQTVRVHLRNAMKKLEVGHPTELRDYFLGDKT